MHQDGGIAATGTALRRRHLASLIPGACLVTLDGDNHLMLAGDPAWPRFLEELDAFLAARAD